MQLPQPSQNTAQQHHTRLPPVIPRHRSTPPVLGFVPPSLSGILEAPETPTDRPMPKRPDILPPTLAPRGLSRTEAAAYIGVSPTLFDHLVRDRRMPPPKRINARTVWDRKKLDRAFELIPDGDHSDHNPWDD
ncbi:helix-turn-helix transcriptional regulator [Marivita cryptomonadis]|nr:helix-turn-helix transcriptional regulator [Marivita cryptomonadis]